MKRDDVRLSASPDDGDAADDTEGETSSDTVRYRTLWISDLHLGTPGCQAKALLDFLRRTECETLFLVGDIIDGWQLRRQWFWPQAHNDVRAKDLGSAAVLLALVLCFVTWVLLAGAASSHTGCESSVVLAGLDDRRRLFSTDWLR